MPGVNIIYVVCITIVSEKWWSYIVYVYVGSTTQGWMDDKPPYTHTQTHTLGERIVMVAFVEYTTLFCTLFAIHTSPSMARRTSRPIRNTKCIYSIHTYIHLLRPLSFGEQYTDKIDKWHAVLSFRMDSNFLWWMNCFGGNICGWNMETNQIFKIAIRFYYDTNEWFLHAENWLSSALTVCGINEYVSTKTIVRIVYINTNCQAQFSNQIYSTNLGRQKKTKYVCTAIKTDIDIVMSAYIAFKVCNFIGIFNAWYRHAELRCIEWRLLSSVCLNELIQRNTRRGWFTGNIPYILSTCTIYVDVYIFRYLLRSVNKKYLYQYRAWLSDVWKKKLSSTVNCGMALCNVHICEYICTIHTWLCLLECSRATRPNLRFNVVNVFMLSTHALCKYHCRCFVCRFLTDAIHMTT